jgi:hypothetical protein
VYKVLTITLIYTALAAFPENSPQNAPFNQGNAEKRLVSILARIPKIFEPGMVLHLFHCNRPHQFRDQPGQPLMHRHPQAADALPAKSNGRSQNQVRAIRFQQVCRADVGVESLGNEGNHIHQRFGGLPPSAARFAISSSVSTLTCPHARLAPCLQLRSRIVNLIRSPPSKSGPVAERLR